MKITGGHWCNRKLIAPRSRSIRPTSARVRESIFGLLASLRTKEEGIADCLGWRCLDFFAGTGALGIEALSRQGEYCIFVEHRKESIECLRRNLVQLSCEGRSQILKTDALHAFSLLESPIDLVLADPPYQYPHWEKFFNALAKAPFFMEKTILVLEHDPKQKLPTAPFSLYSHRILGPAAISVFTSSP